ncbi:hypothetical protein GCM10025794_00760 [Massilia kyonggiensis]|nr:hypothetical protein [Massilia kyonggiensis]
MSNYRQWNPEAYAKPGFKSLDIRLDRIFLVFLLILAPVFLYFFSPLLNPKSAIAEAQSSSEFRALQKKALSSDLPSGKDRWFFQYPTSALTTVELSFESYHDINNKTVLSASPDAALRIRYDRVILLLGVAAILFLVLIFLVVNENEASEKIVEKKSVKKDELEFTSTPATIEKRNKEARGVETVVDTPSQAFEQDVLTSLTRADSFFTRSTLLLGGGIIMAFIGVTIFYLTLPETQKDETLTSYWPKAIRPVGVLFFLESIAWFLLRQYRTLVEDYKWFYRVYLKRANYLTALRILTKDSIRAEEMFVAASLMQYDVSGHLKAGETTEWLEAAKTPEANMVVELLKAITSLPEKIKPQGTAPADVESKSK